MDTFKFVELEQFIMKLQKTNSLIYFSMYIIMKNLFLIPQFFFLSLCENIHSNPQFSYTILFQIW